MSQTVNAVCGWLPESPQGDGARRGHLDLTAPQHHPLDLAAAPGVVALVSNSQNLGFYSLWCTRWAAHRATRTVGKPGSSFHQIPPQPFMAIAAANPKAPAQLAYARARRQRQPHELLPLVHDGLLPPRHRLPPRSTESGRTSVLDVSERVRKVSSMSPVCTPWKGRVARLWRAGWGEPRVIRDAPCSCRADQH